MSDPLLQSAIETYESKFGVAPEVAVFAPGRVNLIGEHTDYNGGFVLPFALPFRTVVVASRVTNSHESSIYSANADEGESMVKFQINESLSKGEPFWANYVKGTVFQYAKDLPANFAFNAVMISDVPIGSGLSSSASLEVSIATLLEKLCDLKVPGVEKALRCQKAEHTFVGTPCGIMDQFISSMGQKNHLLLIDCRHSSYELIPFGSGDEGPVVLVTNSNVKHQLSGSEYPDRVRQCLEAVQILQAKYPAIKAMRDCASMEILDSVKALMTEVVYNRASHCVSEDRRTLSAVKCLKAGNFVVVGKLMTESHNSLRDLYEVSCEELDCLVELALEVEGVYGSRMTGGGFGGCTVTLVKRESVAKLIRHLKEGYQRKANQVCDCYVTAPDNGAGILDITTEASKQTRKKESSIYPIILIPTLVVALGIVLFKLLRK
mmetsp:Transcript_13570/g.13155  ORF Transcript_13570/g.13155 Transcript_13570/m.13155 type:complete len:435 (-) Transcript_13570:68-1372(-)